MANEGHVNYDVSNVSIEAIGSRTTGSGCATVGYCMRDDAKNRSSFFQGSARRRKHDTHRTDAHVGTGCVGKGRGKGGGVLLLRVTALFLGEGTRRVTMEIAPWCGATISILDGVA
jgi:hypothetical protein